MPLKLLSPGGGSVILQANTTGSNYTVNVPAVNGNMVTTADTGTITQAMLGSGVYAGYGPSFSAYNSSAVTITGNNVWNKLTLQTKEWDTANCFDNTTNYRFTPNVAGYYQFSCAIQLQTSINLALDIYKNGSEYRRGCYTNPNTINGISMSSLIYMNGSTDYVEMFCFNGSASSVLSQPGAAYTYFTGFLARSA